MTEPIGVEQLYNYCNLDIFDFKTTEEIEIPKNLSENIINELEKITISEKSVKDLYPIAHFANKI